MSRSTRVHSTAGGTASQGRPGAGATDKNGATERRRLVYAPADEFDRWRCRPLGTIGILDLRDQNVGHLAGLLIDRLEDQPVYLAVAGRGEARDQAARWFLVPVGDAWFDETQRAIRVDVSKRERIEFDPAEFERMTADQADEYERHVLAACCPEVGFHRDGRPDYARLSQFTCPTWLRPSATQS